MIDILSLRAVYIFGAQSRARTLKGYLDCLAPDCTVLAFLVDDDDAGNPESIDGAPVLNMVKTLISDCDTSVFIATKGVYHEQITATLHEHGMTQIVPLSPELENLLRNQYVDHVLSKNGYRFPHVSALCDATIGLTGHTPRVYMAKSVYDAPLKTRRKVPEYMTPIQAGAALTDERIAELRDDIGENISRLNQQYNEETVLYWLWKHTDEPWIGLCQYRRWFDLLPETVAAIPAAQVDVILPVPTLSLPNVSENFGLRHGREHWDFMMNWLQKNEPEYHKTACELFYGPEHFGNLYFPCNMFITRREILDEYCRWLFPILAAIAENGGIKEDIYMNRYVGTISERLLTLYFMHHAGDYLITLADKQFIS